MEGAVIAGYTFQSDKQIEQTQNPKRRKRRKKKTFEEKFLEDLVFLARIGAENPVLKYVVHKKK